MNTNHTVTNHAVVVHPGRAHYNLTVVKLTVSRLTLSRTNDKNNRNEKPTMDHNSGQVREWTTLEPVTNCYSCALFSIV